MILALDPSLKKIGWAIMEEGRVLKYGSFAPLGTTLDAKLMHAGNWLSNLLLEQNGADLMAIEMPMVVRNPATTIKLAQMVGTLRYVAWPWTFRTVQIYPAERLKAFGLKGNMKRKEAKELVLKMVNLRYDLEIDDYDIADAIAVGTAALEKIGRE